MYIHVHDCILHVHILIIKSTMHYMLKLKGHLDFWNESRISPIF